MPAAPSDFSPQQGKGSPSVRPGAPALSPTRTLSLHARLAARDEQALAELIEVVTPWLLGMAQALLSDPDEAEEVVQEAFTIVWNRIGQVPNEPRGLLAWVLRTARNRAIDRLRSRKRRLWKFAHLVATGMDGEPFAEAEEPNEAGAPGWHVHQTVHAALEALPREQRVVVRLAYFHGLTHSAPTRTRPDQGLDRMTAHDWYLKNRVGFATRSLEEREEAIFADHVSRCEECRVAVAELERDLAWLPMGVASVAPRPGLTRSIMERVLRRPRTRWWQWAVSFAAAASLLLAVGVWTETRREISALRRALDVRQGRLITIEDKAGS